MVTVRRPDGGEMDVFVAPRRTRCPAWCSASPSSPLGAALLGARIGATVSYEAPGGMFEVEIVAVRPFEG